MIHEWIQQLDSLSSYGPALLTPQNIPCPNIYLTDCFGVVLSTLWCLLEPHISLTLLWADSQRLVRRSVFLQGSFKKLYVSFKLSQISGWVNLSIEKTLPLPQEVFNGIHIKWMTRLVQQVHVVLLVPVHHGVAGVAASSILHEQVHPSLPEGALKFPLKNVPIERSIHPHLQGKDHKGAKLYIAEATPSYQLWSLLSYKLWAHLSKVFIHLHSSMERQDLFFNFTLEQLPGCTVDW